MMSKIDYIASVMLAVQVYEARHNAKPAKLFFNPMMKQGIINQNPWTCEIDRMISTSGTFRGIPWQEYYDGGTEPDFYIAERGVLFSEKYLFGTPESEDVTVKNHDGAGETFKAAEGKAVEYRAWPKLQKIDKAAEENDDIVPLIEDALRSSKPDVDPVLAAIIDTYEIKYEPMEGVGVGAYVMVPVGGLTPNEITAWERMIKDKLLRYAGEIGKNLGNWQNIVKDWPGGYKSIGVKAYFV
jgi:hypothetical protein